MGSATKAARKNPPGAPFTELAEVEGQLCSIFGEGCECKTPPGQAVDRVLAQCSPIGKCGTFVVCISCDTAREKNDSLLADEHDVHECGDCGELCCQESDGCGSEMLYVCDRYLTDISVKGALMVNLCVTAAARANTIEGLVNTRCTLYRYNCMC
jgi:hypothetical protein